MKKRLAEIRERKIEIRTQLSGNGNVDLQALKDELEKLDIEERSIQERQEIAQKIVVNEVETRTIVGKDDEKVETFGADSKEYRSAFFKSLKGEDLTEVEKRALTFTTSTAGAVIPTETLNKIFEKLEQDSVLYPLVQHYSIAGNLGISVETTDSEATWTAEASEGADSTGKITNVVLSAYQLCKFVSVSAQVAKMSIDALETFIINSLTRKLHRAVDKAILEGTGSNQPTGIAKGITFTEVTELNYDAICDIDAKLNSEYSKGAVFVMNKTTRNLVKKIKNEIGDPIFVQNTANGMGDMLDGKPVVVYDGMADNKIVYGNFNNYVFNFASNPTIDKSRDAGFYTNSEVYRISALADGKPIRQEAFVGVEIKGA